MYSFFLSKNRIILIGIISVFSCLLSTTNVQAYESALVKRTVNEVLFFESLNSDVKPRPAREGKDVVKPENALRTGPNSRAEMLFQDKSLARVGANSTFSLKREGREVQVAEGTALLQVPKGSEETQIHTSTATAALTGTTMLVEQRPGAYAKNIVVEGKARISMPDRPGESMNLNAGQMLVVPSGAERLPEPVDVHLGELVATSGLIQFEDDESEESDGPFDNPTEEFEEDDGSAAESVSAEDFEDQSFNYDQIEEDLEKQNKEIEAGNLEPTDLVLEGDGRNVTVNNFDEETNEDFELASQDEQSDVSDIQEPDDESTHEGNEEETTGETTDEENTEETQPPLIDDPDPFELGDQKVTLGSSDVTPKIDDQHEGGIYDPEGGSVFSEYLFGETNDFDEQVGFDSLGSGPLADLLHGQNASVFKFSTLDLQWSETNSPTISTNDYDNLVVAANEGIQLPDLLGGLSIGENLSSLVFVDNQLTGSLSIPSISNENLNLGFFARQDGTIDVDNSVSLPNNIFTAIAGSVNILGSSDPSFPRTVEAESIHAESFSGLGYISGGVTVDDNVELKTNNLEMVTQDQGLTVGPPIINSEKSTISMLGEGGGSGFEFRAEGSLGEGQINVTERDILAENGLGAEIENPENAGISFEGNYHVFIRDDNIVRTQPADGLESGGDIHVESSYDGGAALEVSNSTQLEALANDLNHSGDIRLLTDGGEIEVSESSGGTTRLDSAEGNIEIGPVDPSVDKTMDVTLQNAELSANEIRARTMGSEGTLTIDGMTMDASDQLNVYGVDGASILFTGNNSTLNGNSTKNIAAQTVEVDGVEVTVSGGNLTIYADNKQYNVNDGAGSFIPDGATISEDSFENAQPFDS